ncbi:MAG TPA: hypothetical protein DCY20_08015 [Firmicutes bacterium]|nr:hypothetical protein [Bacillota bacterium]
MKLDEIQVVLLAHREEDVNKFGRNAAAIKYYQDAFPEIINELYQQWFGIYEICIIIHHLSDIQDMKENVNELLAVNGDHGFAAYTLNKPKGKIMRYVFIIFNKDEQEARQAAYDILRPILLQNDNPVKVNIDFHYVTFY